MLISLEFVLTRGFQRAITLWLTLFSIGSGVLSALAPHREQLTIEHVFLLSIGNFVLYITVLSVCILPYLFSLSPSERYIRDHHPDIWQKTYPARRLLWSNSIVTIRFALGWLDDGTNETLQLIKARARRMIQLQLWVFFLILAPIPIALLSSLVDAFG